MKRPDFLLLSTGPVFTLSKRARIVGVYEEMAKSESIDPTLVPGSLYIPAAWMGRNASGPVRHHQMRFGSDGGSCEYVYQL